jgi:hypothetical protein
MSSWIETTWNNMSDPDAFAVAGAEEQEGGGAATTGRRGCRRLPDGVRAGFGSDRVMPLHRMAGNVDVGRDPAGNLKPVKDKSIERIDGILATIVAIGRAMVAQEESQPEYSLFFV